MENKDLIITGYSTALFSTWIFVEGYKLLFDAGDGVSAGLLQKGRKIKNIFISHADRDHLTGLFQFNQLNARNGFPIVHYPKDCGTFPAMAAFMKKFDPHMLGTVWKSIDDGEMIKIQDNVFIQSIQNGHVVSAKDKLKSLSYKIIKTKRKLKSEFSHLNKNEIQSLVMKNGKEYISEELKETILGYSGDSPVENYERWDKTKILIHEATFLDDSIENKNHNRNIHSKLPDVLEMVANIKVEKLILTHFSSRYSNEVIDETIKKLCKHFNIKIPVFRILPGKIHKNILAENPINE